MKRLLSQRLLYVALLALPIGVALFALCLGRYVVPPQTVLEALMAGPHGASESSELLIVWNVRLPRILLSFLVGAGLSLSGCCFQSVFANPLAAPDTLGVSSGSAFGAALGILLSFGSVLTQAMAILFGIAATGLTFLLSRSRTQGNLLMIVLAGIITAAFCNALVSMLKYIADPLTKLPEITYWLLGSMRGASWHDVIMAASFILIPAFILFLLRWRLNILLLPDDEIRALGMNTTRIRWVIILLCTSMVAVSVSVCGQVGWVGLVIPHMARRVVGTDHRTMLPVCLSFGGIYLLLIDTIARTLMPGELPLSILTAIVGVPLFVVLFFRKGGMWFDAGG